MARTRRFRLCHHDWEREHKIIAATRRVPMPVSAPGAPAGEETELLGNILVIYAVVQLAPACWHELLQQSMAPSVEQDYHAKREQFWQVWLDDSNHFYEGTTFRLEAETVRNRVQQLKAQGVAADRKSLLNHVYTNATHSQLSMALFLIRFFESQEPDGGYPRSYGYVWSRYNDLTIPVINAHAFSKYKRLQTMVGSQSGGWMRGPYAVAWKVLVENGIVPELRSKIMALAFP
tara:strand:- start:1825 stop:2523 length:699 start_codon:yes stop_codon:yes gene_type:complete